MTVLTARSFDGSPLPLATVGFSPNFAPAVTAGSGPSTIFGGGGAEAEAEADGLLLDSAVSDLSSPQPASVTSPAGTARRSERRRTVGALVRSILVDGVRATLLTFRRRPGFRPAPDSGRGSGGCHPGQHCRHEKGAVRKTYDAPRCVPRSRPERSAHIPAINFSTRSSTLRNGSLHNTVRCAWSFSLRCTQSTVKSRRCS